MQFKNKLACMTLMGVLLLLSFLMVGAEYNFGSTAWGANDVCASLAGCWKRQTYEDSRGITKVMHSSERAYEGEHSLKLIANLVGGDKNLSKGEVFVELRSPVNLEDKNLRVWIYAPIGSRGDPDRSNGFQIFVKDEIWRSEYGTWVNIEEEQWNEVTLTPNREKPDGGWMDFGFDPTRIVMVGVKVAIGEESLAQFEGSFYMDSFECDGDVCFDFEGLIEIPDPNLEALIRKAIDRPEGPITDTDLQGITGLVDHSKRGIVNLTGLEYCTSLHVLYLRYNGMISDITPLANLTSLTWLDLGYNQISDITPLANLTGLTELWLASNQISDITPLANLTGLTELWLASNQISDISSLANLTSLTELNLGGNQISDITPLANLTGLTELNLASNQISDITPLANLTGLTELWLASNQISDISSLANLTGLTELNLASNQISDITPLANLTELTVLDLESNQISDISPLAGLPRLTELFLNNNQISDIQPLVDNSGIDSGDWVLLNNNPLSYTSQKTLIPILEDREVGVSYRTGVVTLDSAGPPTWSYTLTSQGPYYVHKYTYNWFYEGAGITGARVIGEAAAAGWTVEYQDATRVTFANSNPLRVGSVSGFEITGTQGGKGSWLCGRNSGCISGPVGGDFTLNLYPGINMISLPRSEVLDAECNLVTLEKASDLVGVLGSTLSHIIYIADGKFKAYIPGVSSDIPLSGEDGYILTMTSADTLVFRGDGWPADEISLPQGIHLIGLPLKLKGVDTFSALVDSISGSVSRIIYLDDNKFKAFIPNITDDVAIEGGMGLIVVMESDGSFPYSGAPWSNEILASPSKITNFPLSLPVMTVDGTVIDGENGFSLDNLSVTVRNHNSGFSISDNANGRFSVTFVDLFSTYCFNLGDIFEIEISDRAGNHSVDNIRHTVTQEDIQSGRIALGNILAQRIPKRSRLLANYPNPFNPETWIPYQLAQDAPVTIHIYNTKGQLIRILHLGNKKTGIYTTKDKAAYWDGRDSSGEKVASGVYYYTLRAGEFKATRKMVTLK